MNLNNISRFIEKCNSRPFYFFQEVEKSDEAEIKELEALTSIEIPSELKEFYLNIGGLKPDYNNEHLYNTWTIDIYSPRDLICKLKEENKRNKLYSLGLIDMILFSWQHDRPEFKEYMKSEDIAFLNESYKSFGSYTTSSEGTYTYLYFDKEGKFGTITYDQDMFDSFVETYLNPMLKGSLASKSFESCLLDAMEEINAELD